MNDQKTVVDYTYWLKMDLWTIKEAASLLSSIEPNSDASNSMIPLKVENLIQAGIIAEELVRDRVNPKTSEDMFYPMNVIHWVKFQKGFSIPAPIDEWYGEEYHYQKIQEANEELYEPEVMSVEQDKNQITENERTKLLKVIGLLVEAFANTNKEFRYDDKSIVYGSGDMGKTGKTNIINELLKVSDNLKNPPKGLGKTTLQDVIKSGVKVLNNES